MLEMASKVLFNEQTKVETQRFTWKIPHFPKLVKCVKTISLQQVSFQVGGSIDIPTNFTCFLKKLERPNYPPCLGFSLKLAEPFPPNGVAIKANAIFDLQILSNTGNMFYCDNSNLDMESLLKGSTIDFQYVFQDFLHSGISPDLLQPENDTLSVNLTATIFNLDANAAAHFSSILTTFKETSLQKMMQDLKTLYQDSGSWSWRDGPTKVLCQDGTQFNVNRGILYARSPVFRTMFQTGMSEADCGHVKIDEIPSTALDVFLHFVHTGELKDSWKEPGILEGLTYAAHKYELNDLFQFLDQIFGHLVNPENCGRLMNLAYILGMKEAEEKLMDYFKREVTLIEQAARIMNEASSVLDLYPKESEVRSTSLNQ